MSTTTTAKPATPTLKKGQKVTFGVKHRTGILKGEGTVTGGKSPDGRRIEIKRTDEAGAGKKILVFPSQATLVA